MKPSYWLIVFVSALVADLVAIMANNQLLQYIAKPMLMITLAGYFINRTKGGSLKFKRPVLMAITFSWIGDVLLMFAGRDELFFILGLASFLIAHVFYILFFHQLKKQETIRGRIWPLLIVVVYYIGLLYFLSPYLGDMKLPVRVYGVVISLMCMLALHMVYLRDRTTAKWLVAGALLFIASDSILAIDKFYQPFNFAGFLIMLSYGAAQLFLTVGATKYILGIRNTFDKRGE